MSDPRIRPRRGFVAGGDKVWVCILFYTGFQSDLRSFYILSILLLLSYLSFASGLSCFRLLKWSGLGRVSMVWVREVTTEGVGWASEEASDLVVPPMNLMMYMHLRVFEYTSNTLITSFEYMELILASGTLKNFRFLMRSCLSTDRAPVIKLICSTFQSWRCITVLMALRRDTYWFSVVWMNEWVLIGTCKQLVWSTRIGRNMPIWILSLVPDEVSFTDVGHPFVFQNTKGPGRVTHGWEDCYSVRSYPSETFFHDCLFWDPLFDSSFFSRREEVSHFTGSCRVPYRLLCQVQVLYILEFGCNFVPYSLEAFLAWDA